MNDIEIRNNDIYYMEILGDKVIINDNYNGLFVLDSNLEQICKIELFQDLTIYSSFKYQKEILLFCPYNECLVYIDIESNKIEKILLGKFKDWIFSPLYNWYQDNVVLSDYDSHFVKVDLINGRIEAINLQNTMYQMIRDDIGKLSKYQINKIYYDEKKAIVFDQSTKVNFIDYRKNIEIIDKFERGHYFDFEWKDGCVVKVSNNKIQIIYDDDVVECNSDRNYEFLRAKIMNFNKKARLFLLSALKSNSKVCKIKIIEL